MSLDTDRMAALRQRFIASVGDQADQIEAFLASDDIEGARGIAHGLAGRSGLFGFAELGEIAREADEADEADPSAFRHRAHELLAALRSVAQEG